ncbi:Uncharacterised protein g8422 [Pycnogonum litorale]
MAETGNGKIGTAQPSTSRSDGESRPEENVRCYKSCVSTPNRRLAVGIAAGLLSSTIVPFVNIVTKLALEHMNVSTFSFIKFVTTAFQVMPALYLSRAKINFPSYSKTTWILLLASSLTRIVGVMMFQYSLNFFNVSTVAVFSCLKQAVVLLISTCIPSHSIHPQDSASATLSITGAMFIVTPSKIVNFIENIRSEGFLAAIESIFVDRLNSTMRHHALTLNASPIPVEIVAADKILRSAFFGNSLVENPISIVREKVVTSHIPVLAFICAISFPILYAINSQIALRLKHVPFSFNAFVQSLLGIVTTITTIFSFESFTPPVSYYVTVLIVVITVLNLKKSALDTLANMYVEKLYHPFLYSLRVPFTFFLEYELLATVPSLSVVLGACFNLFPLITPTLRILITRLINNIRQRWTNSADCFPPLNCQSAS